MFYKKDFKRWLELKPDIDKKKERKVFFKEREIWWTSIGVNVGSEIDGKNNLFERPVLIVKKINRKQFIGVPLTSKNKKGYFYKNFNKNILESSINISQIRCLSSNRLIRKIKTLDMDAYTELLKSIAVFLKLI